MTLKKTIFIIIIFLNSTFILKLYAQSYKEVKIMTKVISVNKNKVIYKNAINNNSSTHVFFSSLFKIYKSFFSSQDVISCAFTPSCSEYALGIIKKKGLIIGALSTFDRLTRCNSLSPEKYTIHSETHLLSDPVE